MQYADGLFGALIVRNATDKDVYGYDEERVLMFGEWFHRPGPAIVGELQALRWVSDFFPPRQSSFMCSQDVCQGCAENCTACFSPAVIDCECVSAAMFDDALCHGKYNTTAACVKYLQSSAAGQAWLNTTCPTLSRRATTAAPFPGTTLACNQAPGWLMVNVTAGKRYRFRILNVASGSTMNFHIQNHTSLVIAADGGNMIKPLSLSAPFPVFVAQRYDLIIEANQAPADYWISATGFRCLQAYAMLHYESAPAPDPRNTPAPLVNVDFEMSSPEPDSYSVPSLLYNMSMLTPPPIFNATTTYVFRIGCCENLTARELSKPGATVTPSPVCNQPDLKVKQHLCWVRPDGPNTERAPMAYQNVPAIAHGVNATAPSITVRRGERVRLVLLNEDLHSSHPMHLHGHDIQLLAIGAGNDLGTFDPNNFVPPTVLVRDSFQIPVWSYAVLQFEANNPGRWLMHCHIDWHLDAGLSLLVNEIVDEIPAPPPGPRFASGCPLGNPEPVASAPGFAGMVAQETQFNVQLNGAQLYSGQFAGGLASGHIMVAPDLGRSCLETLDLRMIFMAEPADDRVTALDGTFLSFVYTNLPTLLGNATAFGIVATLSHVDNAQQHSSSGTVNTKVLSLTLCVPSNAGVSLATLMQAPSGNLKGPFRPFQWVQMTTSAKPYVASQVFYQLIRPVLPTTAAMRVFFGGFDPITGQVVQAIPGTIATNLTQLDPASFAFRSIYGDAPNIHPSGAYPYATKIDRFLVTAIRNTTMQGIPTQALLQSLAAVAPLALAGRTSATILSGSGAVPASQTIELVSGLQFASLLSTVRACLASYGVNGNDPNIVDNDPGLEDLGAIQIHPITAGPRAGWKRERERERRRRRRRSEKRKRKSERKKRKEREKKKKERTGGAWRRRREKYNAARVASMYLLVHLQLSSSSQEIIALFFSLCPCSFFFFSLSLFQYKQTQQRARAQFCPSAHSRLRR